MPLRRASSVAVSRSAVAVSLVVGLLEGFAPAAAFAQDPPSQAVSSAANPSGRKYPLRVYQTVRLEGKGPSIDGRLDDEAWRQGEWSGGFTQHIPTEGADPSQRTEMKILYDDRNIYFAIRAYDDPAKVHRYPGRRDDFVNYAVDIVGICFDSYNSKQSGFEFDLTAGGGKIDLILGNGEHEWDTTWDAVWDGKVAHDEQGWTAEFRVPLSQLRYGPHDAQVWGIHAWRWIARSQEEVQWQLIPRQNTGRMHQIGELRGIRGLPRSRHIEIMPQVLGKASSGPSVPTGGTDGAGSAGLDAKVGLTSNFTLDATVNPDFGQVEADPSVMNLTAYETFYEEKRPFFLEGRKTLTFDLEDEDQLFYSRRIGEAPSYRVPTGPGESVSLPESTTILGAFKVTGRTEGGLSVAALQAFTQKEAVGVAAASGGRNVVVEPFGSYSVGRVHKDWDKGNTSLGGMVTSTRRWVSEPHLAYLPTQATAGGVDFTRYFADRAWVLEAKGAVSRVSGDSAAILALQRNAVHYYQRPDADHLGVDPARTSLSGHGGSVRFGRSGSSRLSVSDKFRWYSPGFDLNDIGYLGRADTLANQVVVGWSETVPKGRFRSYAIEASRGDEWDFGGLRTRTDTDVELDAQFTNMWSVSGSLEYRQSVDTRALRGGPAIRRSDAYEVDMGVRTDASRRVFLSLFGSRETALDGGSDEWQVSAQARLRPSNRLSLSANASFESSIDDLQYVGTVASSAGTRWLLGRIDQETWSLTLRANLALSPDLTIQYYGSPFIATGRYSAFKRAADTLAKDYEGRFHRLEAGELTYVPQGDRYEVVESGGGAAYGFRNPDFSFQEFRSNLVARWEYKPGSSLYVVWSQGRTGDSERWNDAVGANWRDLWRSRPDNVLLVKLSYWFSL